MLLGRTLDPRTLRIAIVEDDPEMLGVAPGDVIEPPTARAGDVKPPLVAPAVQGIDAPALERRGGDEECEAIVKGSRAVREQLRGIALIGHHRREAVDVVPDGEPDRPARERVRRIGAAQGEQAAGKHLET